MGFTSEMFQRSDLWKLCCLRTCVWLKRIWILEGRQTHLIQAWWQLNVVEDLLSQGVWAKRFGEGRKNPFTSLGMEGMQWISLEREKRVKIGVPNHNPKLNAGQTQCAFTPKSGIKYRPGFPNPWIMTDPYKTINCRLGKLWEELTNESYSSHPNTLLLHPT